MKYILLLLVCSTLSITVDAQSQKELMDMKTQKAGLIEDLEAQIKAAQGELDVIQVELDKLAGWRKGVSGIFGLDWNRSSNWISNPEPDSRAVSLGIDITGYLMNDKEKTFWHNKASIVKAWNDVDFSQADIENPDDGLFKNGTVDILNISSLAGYKFTEKLAASGQAELNTSIGNFLKPGTFDIGVGVTWLPIKNLTVLVHPFNYNVAFPADGSAFSTSGSFGAKVRADYFTDFVVAGKDVSWTTTLTAYLPYTSLDPIIIDGGGTSMEETPSVTSYTWLNNLSFELWRGIGIGIGWGLRKADFESEDLQSYSKLGLSYSIN